METSIFVRGQYYSDWPNQFADIAPDRPVGEHRLAPARMASAPYDCGAGRATVTALNLSSAPFGISGARPIHLATTSAVVVALRTAVTDIST